MNIALYKGGSQSSTYAPHYGVDKATDKVEGTYSTTKFEPFPSWITIDLGRLYFIGTIITRSMINCNNTDEKDVIIKILAFNNYAFLANPPNWTNYYSSWKNVQLEREFVDATNNYRIQESIPAYRYVAVLAPPKRCQLKLENIEVHEREIEYQFMGLYKNTERIQVTKISSQVECAITCLQEYYHYFHFEVCFEIKIKFESKNVFKVA